MIKVFLLDVYENKTGVIEIDPNNLDAMYGLIDCRCIDIVTRKVRSRQFDIVCDDEGLFREPQKISAIGKNGEPMLVGNLIFCHHDHLGNLTGLDAEDINLLMDNMMFVFTDRFPSSLGHYAVFGMSY